MVDILQMYGDRLKEWLGNNINRQNNSLYFANSIRSESTLINRPYRTGSNSSTTSLSKSFKLFIILIIIYLLLFIFFK